MGTDREDADVTDVNGFAVNGLEEPLAPVRDLEELSLLVVPEALKSVSGISEEQLSISGLKEGVVELPPPPLSLSASASASPISGHFHKNPKAWPNITAPSPRFCRSRGLFDMACCKRRGRFVGMSCWTGSAWVASGEGSMLTPWCLSHTHSAKGQVLEGFTQASFGPTRIVFPAISPPVSSMMFCISAKLAQR